MGIPQEKKSVLVKFDYRGKLGNMRMFYAQQSPISRQSGR
jgi:hypothetical protein